LKIYHNILHGNSFSFAQPLPHLRIGPQYHIFTFVVGAAAFGIIHGIKKFRPHFPAGLLALVLTTTAVWLLQLQEKGVAIVGEIPSGLPHLILPPLDYETTVSLLGPAIVIALVSFAAFSSKRSF
jgi:SulP family sulfate permease